MQKLIIKIDFFSKVNSYYLVLFSDKSGFYFGPCVAFDSE